MGTLRVCVMIGAALCAGLSLAAAAGANSQKSLANAPLLLTPAAKPAKATHHAAKPRKPARTARRHAAPAVAEENENRIMRGADTFRLIARLPWWRSEELQTIRYRQKEVESQVLASTDAWFTAQGTAPERDYALASAEEITTGDGAVSDRTADAVPIADPDAVNAIDLAALDEQPGPDKSPDKSWLEILLATLGGALAAASTARFLFV